MQKSIYAVGTMDTKGAELEWLADRIRNAGQLVKLVDVGTLAEPTIRPDIMRTSVLAGKTLPDTSHRGEKIEAMGKALGHFLIKELAAGQLSGVIGIGGSGGTSLITQALRNLPVGLPKIMVSTVASGNTKPYVDCSDITMMHSVVDVAGLNVVSKAVLGNAAHAIAGMVRHREDYSIAQETLGMTMFGVTTPCVDQVRESLKKYRYDCLVFHATGTGGRAMEQLVGSNLISGVLDITATEVADEIAGGIFPCGPDRYETLIQKKIPLVLSLGAIDMVNFGGKETIPEIYKNRKFHAHNPQVTLMRTNAEENARIGTWIARKLNRANTPWTLLIPEKGVSSLSIKGQPFHNPDADAACFEALEAELHAVSDQKVIRIPSEINSAEFATCLVDEFRHLAG